MKHYRIPLLNVILLLFSFIAFSFMPAQQKPDYSDAALKKNLSPELYKIAREKGTEAPFSGKYLNNKEKGTYYCAVCQSPLFESEAKFDSHCGWPSFFQPIHSNSLIYQTDNSHGMHRIEILCTRCHSHLGHVFDDGPEPTKKRYCLNSISLHFQKIPEKTHTTDKSSKK